MKKTSALRAINFPKDLSGKIFPSAFFVCGSIFVSLCLLHYFSQRPLWNDEQAVFASIPALSYHDLFGPLLGGQVFPRAQLVLIKWLGSFFNDHLLALRFFSLLFMLSAFLVWTKIYIRSWGDARWSLLAVFSFVCAYQMSYYAAELKPYAFDVLAVGIFFLYFLYQQNFSSKSPTRDLFILSAFVPALVFFSYGAVFVFWIAGFNFILLARKNRSLWPVFAVNAVFSLICFIILQRTDLSQTPYDPGMQDYWKDYFFSSRPGGQVFELFGEGLFEMTRWWYGENKFYWRLASPLIPLVAYALIRFGLNTWRKDGFLIKDPGSLFSVLFLELIVLSWTGKYPFTGDRVTLFLAPLVFFLVVRAIQSLKKIKFVFYLYIAFYIGYLVACLTFSFAHYRALYG